MMSKNYIAVPPGATIKEQLNDRGMLQKEFASRMNLSEKHISKLINGQAQLTQDVAYRLEMVLGIPASFWNNLEANYREQIAKVENENAMDKDIEISKKMAYNEMSKLGWVDRTRKPKERVVNLRKFFEISRLDLLPEGGYLPIACRKLNETSEEDLNLLAWAQKAKLEARNITVGPVNVAGLERSLNEIRCLTISRNDDFSKVLQDKLAEFGVALVYLPHLPGSYLHGATFYDSKKIVVGLTLRGKDADRFWFSLFHEVGHIVHGHLNQAGGLTEMDERASDEFARDILITPEDYESFVEQEDISYDSVKKFAGRIGIDPGIVVGRLQKEGLLQYNQLNDLKTRYSFG